MSRQGGNEARSPYQELWTLPFRIYGGGTAPTAAMMKGATFARGGTGKYIVYPDVNFPFQLGSPAMLYTTLGNQVFGASYYAGASVGFAGHTAGATAYVAYQVNTGGATAGGPGAAIDLVAGEELWGVLCFARTSVP